jgi:hypothetical protein
MKCDHCAVKRFVVGGGGGVGDLDDGFGRALASSYRQTVFYLGFSLMNLFFPNYFIVFQLIHFPCY